MENVNQIDKTEMYELYCECTNHPKSYQSITRNKMAGEIVEYYKLNFDIVIRNLHQSYLSKLIDIYRGNVVLDIKMSDYDYNDLECMLFVVMQYKDGSFVVNFREELKDSFNVFFKMFDFVKQVEFEKAYIIVKGLTRALGFVDVQEIKNEVGKYCDLDEVSITDLVENYYEEYIVKRKLTFTDNIVVNGLHYEEGPLDIEMITDYELFKGPYKEFSFSELKSFAEYGYKVDDETVQELLFTINEATGNYSDYAIFDIFVFIHNTCQKSSDLIEVMVPILDNHFLRIGEGYEIIKQMIKFSATQPKWIYKGFSEQEMLMSVDDMIGVLHKEDYM